MLSDYDQDGMLPKWAQANSESFEMVGDPADPIIADAYAFGARDFDAGQALRDMVAQATQPSSIRPGQSVLDRYGYLPADLSYPCCNFHAPVSTQLEYDTDDYAIAALARALGDRPAYLTFAARAQNWQNVFNAGTGYMQARLASGAWVPGFTPGTEAGMVEGTAAQYTPMAPFNLSALIAARGGPQAWQGFLDSLLDSLTAPRPGQRPAVQRAEPGDPVGVRLRGRAVEDPAGGAPGADRRCSPTRRRRAGQRRPGRDELVVRVVEPGPVPGDARHGHAGHRQPGVPARDAAPGRRQAAHDRRQEHGLRARPTPRTCTSCG